MWCITAVDRIMRSDRGHCSTSLRAVSRGIKPDTLENHAVEVVEDSESEDFSNLHVNPAGLSTVSLVSMNSSELYVDDRDGRKGSEQTTKGSAASATPHTNDTEEGAV